MEVCRKLPLALAGYGIRTLVGYGQALLVGSSWINTTASVEIGTDGYCYYPDPVFAAC